MIGPASRFDARYGARIVSLVAVLAIVLASKWSLFAEQPTAQPELESPTTTQPATSQPSAVPDELSAEECLQTAGLLLSSDNFPRARLWYQAAADRAKSNTHRQAAKTALDQLELLGQVAPKLSVRDWIQGGRPIPRALEGKVIVMFFFEIIDPETKHAVAEINTLIERHRGRDVEVVGFACVLGDEVYQQPDDIRQYLSDEGIGFRVGIDDGGVMTLNTYKGKAVPHIVVIDRAARVRRIGLPAADVDFTVRKLLAEQANHTLPGEHRVMPQSRAGRELIDTRAPKLSSDAWANTPDDAPPILDARPRLVRFLTDDCAYCRSTIPALNRLHRDYAERGLMVIGVYHPKPRPRAVGAEEFRAMVRRMEIEFPCALDADWTWLRRAWLDAGDRRTRETRDYTSASLLIDKRGRIRFVHPGPDFFPSENPERARQNEDYKDIRAAIEKVLSE